MEIIQQIRDIKSGINKLNAEFLQVMQSANFTSLEDVKKIFIDQYIGPDFSYDIYGTAIPEIKGVRMNPLVLEKFAKAGHWIIYMPEISISDIVKQTANVKQKDGVVMYYPDQFNTDGSINKPWFKEVDGFDFSPYILGMENTKAKFIIVKPEEIAGTPSKTISAQLPIQKQYHLDILGDAMPADLKLACDTLTPEVLNCLKRLEDKDWQSATGLTLSLPFVQSFWPDLVTDMYMYATLSSKGVVTRRGMYNRVKTASPSGDFLMFGYSSSGADVGSYRASSADPSVGLHSSCIIEIV